MLSQSVQRASDDQRLVSDDLSTTLSLQSFPGFFGAIFGDIWAIIFLRYLGYFVLFRPFRPYLHILHGYSWLICTSLLDLCGISVRAITINHQIEVQTSR